MLVDCASDLQHYLEKIRSTTHDYAWKVNAQGISAGDGVTEACSGHRALPPGSQTDEIDSQIYQIPPSLPPSVPLSLLLSFLPSFPSYFLRQNLVYPKLTLNELIYAAKD